MISLSEAAPTSAGGVIASSLLTLVVVPVVYCYLDDLSAWMRRKFSRHTPAASALGADPRPLRERMEPVIEPDYSDLPEIDHDRLCEAVRER